MKKSLLALAVLGAFAGAAQAQTNVTLYGLVDTGIVVSDDGEDRATRMESGIGAATRVGIRGSEDLGSGLKAHFVLENGFDSDTGNQAGGIDVEEESTGAFSRLAYIGLDGGFGTVRLGRQDTAMKDATGKIDPFGAAGMANMHDYFLGGMAQRRSNQLTYLTPNFGGLNGGVYYNFGEERGAFSEGSIFGVRAGYDNGPIHAQIAHEQVRDSGVIDNDQKDTLIGGAYNFGVATLHAAFGNRSVDVGDEFRSAMLGVSANLGAGKAMVSYTRVENRDADDADSDVLALGYNYALSKRTAVIARYVRAANDDGAAVGVAGGDIVEPFVGGETAQAIGVGIQHRF